MRTFSMFLTVLGLAMIVYGQYYIGYRSPFGKLGYSAWTIGLIGWVLSYTTLAVGAKCKGKKKK